MPVIARFLWLMVVVLLVLAIYTSLTQQEEQTADNGTDSGGLSSYFGYDKPQQNTQKQDAHKQNTQKRIARNQISRDVPVADDPPIPGMNGGGTPATGQSTVTEVVEELESSIPMSVDAAYAAIPHKRTTYRAESARIAGNDSAYLEQFFALTDQMTAARMAVYTQLYYGYGGMSVADYNTAYEKALKGFAMLNPPASAVEAHRQVVKAIMEQHDFVNEWDRAGPAAKNRIKNNISGNANVQSSHRRLLRAYGILKQSYPNDSANNVTSFFDHLCALDFI